MLSNSFLKELVLEGSSNFTYLYVFINILDNY